jgi:hypothetical protein
MHERFDASPLRTSPDQPVELLDETLSVESDLPTGEQINSSDLQAWAAEHYAEVSASIHREVEHGTPWKVLERRLPHEHRTGAPSEAAISLIAAEEVDRRVRQALVQVALHRLGNRHSTKWPSWPYR